MEMLKKDAFREVNQVRYKLCVVATTLCFMVCVLSLIGCEQKNSEQSQSPDITESAGIEHIAAPTASAPLAEPSDDASAKVSGDEEHELSFRNVGVLKLDTNTKYSFDLDGNGVTDTLELRNNEPQWSCDVLFNAKKINNSDDWTSISQAHLIYRADDSVALIYQQDGDGGNCTTSIYTFTEGKAIKTEYRRNAYSLKAHDSLLLTAPVFYFLGNQAVSIEAAINKDFTLTLGNDGWFAVITEPYSGKLENKYRAKVDIPMQRFEDGKYTDATLPAGTRVYPQLINEAQTRMIMKTDDGTLWMYTRDSAGLHFEEGELFEGCTYAGP